ncbi:MAG: hypothetical protein ACRD6X_06225 [Pyrinomonadaceae bacterium]
MELNLKIAGAMMIALALLHIVFPRRFHWKEELASISLLSRQVMYVHTFFIALTVLLMGVLCITSAEMLLNSSLGKRIALGLAIFWIARLLIQFFGYSPTLWKAKAFETAVHIFFSALWVYFSLVFTLVAIR